MPAGRKRGGGIDYLWPSPRIRFLHKRAAAMRKIAILPTLCTLGNGVCGFTSILCAAHVGLSAGWSANLAAYVSGWLIFVAMVFDVLDGYLARRSKTASQFGAELDSLCDAISFGVAPAFLIVHLGAGLEARPARDLLFVVALLYVCCTVLRLARFNVQSTLDAKSHRFFMGLPSPGAAGCVAALVTLRYNFNDIRYVPDDVVAPLTSVVAPVVGVALALLMVSRVPFVHMANRVLHRRRNFNKVVQAVLVVLVVFLFRELALVLFFWGYALYGPARLLWAKWTHTALLPADAAEPPPAATAPRV